MAKPATVVTIVGVSSVLAGGWFWFMQEHWLAAALWLVGVVIIIARKRVKRK